MRSCRFLSQEVSVISLARTACRPGHISQSDRADRHFGLVWGDGSPEGTFELICGSKLRLADVEASLVQEAMSSGGRLLARVRLTVPDGRPNCARLRPPNISWSVIRRLSPESRRAESGNDEAPVPSVTEWVRYVKL